ncbi:transcription factor bHLH68-like isoform X2 [Diospyros lotus]|uniref:transcription factor bHLH68-like isoform X2 n=1 Tax=Diospyros lotus TaxID=55363 RepID=UPI00224F1988|nr:transcription factor bHLH68-like isoform X2 [Diospyros lotus]
MNRGVLQSSPLQQMMAGSPNWWSLNSMKQPPSPQPISPLLAAPPVQFSQIPPSSSSLPLSSSWHGNQDLQESWSHLLLGGLATEEYNKSGPGHHSIETAKKLENWEEQLLHQNPHPAAAVDYIKQENSSNSYVYNADYQPSAKRSWSQMMPASSPTSCVTSLNNNMLDFSSTKAAPDSSSECNSTAAGGAIKKARIHPPPTQQPTFKVRKEKLGDRITALHQLVSPFGKTDTASVLLEAIGYIRFLQSQIEALSLPYLGSGSGNTRQQQSLLNDIGLKRSKGASQQDSQEEPKNDLRSRGLCLVPISCTLQVGSVNGADYWAPAALGGGFR